MRTITPEFQEHLDSGMTTLVWCWRLTRNDGAIFGFTDHDRTLEFDGTMFEPESGFTGSEINSAGDMSVDAQEVIGKLDSLRITETDILDGRWDDASVEVWRVNWQDPGQRLLVRRGTTGQLKRGRVSFEAEVRSLTYKLSQNVGRTYQATCDARLGDARCGVNLDQPTYKGTGTMSGLENDRRVLTTDLGQFADGWFSYGVLTWTSGANDGRSAEVLTHLVRAADVALTLREAPVRPIAPGDTFSVQAGCDKKFSTCRDRFTNTLAFRGHPHIPGEDTVRRYAAPGSGGDGEVL